MNVVTIESKFHSNTLMKSRHVIYTVIKKFNNFNEILSLTPGILIDPVEAGRTFAKRQIFDRAAESNFLECEIVFTNANTIFSV